MKIIRRMSTLLDDNNEPVEECFNGFHRTYILQGTATASNPLFDKWTHMSGMTEEEKNSFIKKWLATVDAYPVIHAPDGFEEPLMPVQAPKLHEPPPRPDNPLLQYDHARIRKLAGQEAGSASEALPEQNVASSSAECPSPSALIYPVWVLTTVVACLAGRYLNRLPLPW